MLRQIRDWLYTGTYADAANSNGLRAQNIGAVLELERPISHEGITSLFLHIQDGLALRPETLTRAVEFVRTQHALNQNVLIACNAGISRSPTLAAVMLKELEALPLHDAFMLVRAANPEAMPDQIIWESLREYYNDGPPFWELWQQLVDL